MIFEPPKNKFYSLVLICCQEIFVFFSQFKQRHEFFFVCITIKMKFEKLPRERERSIQDEQLLYRKKIKIKSNNLRFIQKQSVNLPYKLWIRQLVIAILVPIFFWKDETFDLCNLLLRTEENISTELEWKNIKLRLNELLQEVV